MYFYANNLNHTEIGSWYGSWNAAIPRRTDANPETGPPQTLTTDAWTDLSIELIPGTGTSELDWVPNVANWYVGSNPTPVWTQSWGTYNNRRFPGDVNVTNSNRGYINTDQYIVFDDVALTNMEYAAASAQDPVAAIGLNNVGLIMRLWGTVTERYVAATPSFATSYFHIDDGSGLINPYPRGNGIKCMAPRSSTWKANQENVPGAGDVPNVGDQVWVYGILGMEDGQRYMFTYDGSWVAHP